MRSTSRGWAPGRAPLRNLTSGALVVLGLAAGLVWRSTAEPVRAKPHVPFRLMEASITGTQEALEAGTVTSEDLVRMYLARIAAYDKQGPAINAMIRLNPRALADARALDTDRRHGRSRGPLHGIPIVLKDNYDTYDMPTSAASLSLASSIPPDDGYLVRRLRQAGAVFLGKTNMHEFAYGITTISSLGGQTLNPYDLRRNPGGSSGGTGAAITANFAVFGMGSDTCGSIRIPSSHNSLVGLRVTQGLTSRDGIIPLSLTQDVGGPLARSVKDIAIVMDATSGYDPADPVTAVSLEHTPASYVHFLKEGRLRGARFGLLTDALIVDPPDAEVASVIQRARQELVALGAGVIDVSIPDYNTVSNVSVITYEFKRDLDAYLARTPAAPFKTLQDIFDHPALWHPSLAGVLKGALDNALKEPDYSQRLAGREAFRAAIVKVLDDNHLDALIYPTIRQKPIFVPTTNQPGSNCRVSAQSGLPAISVPVGFTTPEPGFNDGIPVGMEFLGRAFTEGDLLQIAYSWEQATRVRRVPASTPELETRWAYGVTDGVAQFNIDPAARRLRFTAPNMDTFVYIDPAMRDQTSTIAGEFTDDRWHIRYSISTAGGAATIRIDDRRTHEGGYALVGTATAR
jgi:amidase